MRRGLCIGLLGSAIFAVGFLGCKPKNGPVADAGPDLEVPPLARVLLDGSASVDPEGDVLTYRWDFLEIPEGSGAELSNPASMVPRFDADLAGVYEVGLVVSDRETESLQDSVMITVAAEGLPDGDFGTERKGAVFYDNADEDEDRGASVMLLENGKAVLAGRSYNGFDWDIFFRRYNTDGSPDTTFGTGGTVVYNGGAVSESCYDAVMLSDGKMLAAGMLDGDMAVWRFSKDGSLDTGFGSSGIAVYDTAGGAARCTSVTVQPDGKVLAAGFWDQGGDNDIILLRYTADGSPDTGFGSSGVVMYDTSGQDSLWAMGVQGDGKILLGCSIDGGANQDFVVFRYNTDGSPDTGFGTNGAFRYDGGGNDYVNAIAVQEDGSFLAAGTTGTPSGTEIILIRCSADGSLDTGFGSGGMVTFDGGSRDSCTGMCVQVDGKILVTGYSEFGTQDDIVVLRYTADGSLDTGFGPYGTGRMQFDGFADDDWSDTVVLQPDGKILVAGSVWGNGSLGDALLLRYE